MKNLQSNDTYSEQRLKEFVQFTPRCRQHKENRHYKNCVQLAELFEEVYEARVLKTFCILPWMHLATNPVEIIEYVVIPTSVKILF